MRRYPRKYIICRKIQQILIFQKYVKEVNQKLNSNKDNTCIKDKITDLNDQISRTNFQNQYLMNSLVQLNTENDSFLLEITELRNTLSQINLEENISKNNFDNHMDMKYLEEQISLTDKQIEQLKVKEEILLNRLEEKKIKLHCDDDIMNSTHIRKKIESLIEDKKNTMLENSNLLQENISLQEKILSLNLRAKLYNNISIHLANLQNFYTDFVIDFNQNTVIQLKEWYNYIDRKEYTLSQENISVKNFKIGDQVAFTQVNWLGNIKYEIINNNCPRYFLHPFDLLNEKYSEDSLIKGLLFGKINRLEEQKSQKETKYTSYFLVHIE